MDRLQEIKFLWELEGNNNIGGWSTHVRHEDIGWLIKKVEELQKGKYELELKNGSKIEFIKSENTIRGKFASNVLYNSCSED